MKKRGSHVGMVLSFIVFVIFMIFLYYALKPVIEEPEDKKYVLDYLKTVLKEKFSANLTTATISSAGVSCLQVYDNDVGVSDESNSIVKDGENNIIDSKDYGDYLLIANSGETFLWVYYSEEEFNKNYTLDFECAEPTIESIRTEERLFKTKIDELIKRHETGYEGLKTELNLPPGNEFDFAFTYSNGTTIGTEKNVSISIYAEEFPVQYVDAEANIESGSVKIRVW